MEFKYALGMSMAVIMISCSSPRESCEANESPEFWEQLCVSGLASMENCAARELAGEVAPGTCERWENENVVLCAMSISTKDRCSKEIDLPIIPKIVMIHPISLSKEGALHLSHINSNVSRANMQNSSVTYQ